MRLLIVWAIASLASLLLLKTWIAISFIALLGYVMRVIWKTILKNHVSHELVKMSRPENKR
jgi:hypothetical protein